MAPSLAFSYLKGLQITLSTTTLPTLHVLCHSVRVAVAIETKLVADVYFELG